MILHRNRLPADGSHEILFHDQSPRKYGTRPGSNSLTADPGVASSIPARYHTFVEIDHEIISTVILLPSPVLFKKGCCQLQAKVCAQITG